MSGSDEPRSRGRGTSALRRFYLALGIAAALGAGAVGYNIVSGGSSGAVLAPVELVGMEDPDSLVAMARGVTKGNPEARVMIIEFGDYQCPACGQFARDFKPGVEQSLIESGRAQFVFYDYPLIEAHPHAFVAARAARCAEDQGMFWEYHDHLFRQQSQWAAQVSPLDDLEGYATDLGLDARAFRGCLNSDSHAALVTANLLLAQTLRVPRTPTILVNVAGGETREAQGWDAASIEATIDLLTTGGR